MKHHRNIYIFILQETKLGANHSPLQDHREEKRSAPSQCGRHLEHRLVPLEAVRTSATVGRAALQDATTVSGYFLEGLLSGEGHEVQTLF